jgi:hypothetical protein
MMDMDLEQMKKKLRREAISVFRINISAIESSYVILFVILCYE